MKNKDLLADPKFKFVLWFAGIFFCTFIMLYFFGLVPDELINSDQSSLDALRLRTMEIASGTNDPSAEISSVPSTPSTSIPKVVGEKPVHLTIPNTQVDILVQNPTTKDNTLLDEYLTKGTIRYAESALLGAGNVLIFGHSSNWSVVHNEAYKSLNGIETLKRGDPIYVDSATSRYVYIVDTVSLVNASDQYVDFSNGKNMLTLSTCNTFGKKEQRYVVQATFDRKESL